MTEDKPIKLTWTQAVWGASVIFILGGLFVQIDSLRKDVRELTNAFSSLQKDTYDKIQIDERNTRIWEHVKDLEQTVYGKVKPL